MSGRAPTTWRRWPHCIGCYPLRHACSCTKWQHQHAKKCLISQPCIDEPRRNAPQARDGALLEVEELRHEVADLRRMASPVKALRMSRSDSEDEDPLAEQVRDTC